MIFSSLIFAAMIESVRGHGRLIKPTPRVGDTTSYENDPIGFKLDSTTSMDQFICRHASPSNVITDVTAGGNLEVQWDLTAAHPGDCSFYISYDFDKAPADMEWFKVANLMDCKSVRMHQGAGSTDQWDFQLPSWLPGGRAVLRWEWSALHIPTSVEFFVQCVDINIAPTADAIAVDQIPTYKVFDPTPARPESYGTALPGNGVTLTLPMTWEDMSMTPNVNTFSPDYAYSYRSAYNTGSNWPYFMTGPECALGLTINNCELTAVGTQGHVPMQASNSSPVTVPTQAPANPTYKPTPAPTDADNSGNGNGNGSGNNAYPTEQPVNNGDIEYPFYFASSTTMEQRKTMANIAGLLAQCMWESGGQAPWSACDENNYTGLSTASCTQRGDGQLYADLGASDGSDGSCPRDNSMTMTAVTAASWTPGPMKCMPGGELEGCCWWGRGAIQTTGRYNYGHLQADVVSKLGLKESDGSDVDLCSNPQAMCQHDVLKMAGALYYWTSMVQQETCFDSALDTIAQNFNIDAAPSAGCYEFSKGVGGAINNGIWNSYPHGEHGRKGNMQNLIASIESAFNSWDGTVNANAYQCSGDAKIDTLLELANVKSVSMLDQSDIYNWAGFCSSLRAFIPGTPTVYPTGEPVNPTEQPVNPTQQPENPTEQPTAPPTNNADGKCSKYERYAQCGGDGFQQLSGPEYDGCSECPAGTQCFARSQWFSGCTEACPGGDWLCASQTPTETTTQAPETTTAAPVTTTAAPVTTTEAPEEPTTAPGACPNGEWATCGGEGQVIGSGSGQWSGETCCQAGLTCVAESQWYHVCKSARRLDQGLVARLSPQ